MSIFSGRLGRKNFNVGLLLILALVFVSSSFWLSILLVSLDNARQNARNAQQQSYEQQQQIQQALQQYQAETNTSAQVQTQPQ